MSKNKYNIGIYKVSIGYLSKLFQIYESELDLFNFYFLHDVNFNNNDQIPDIILIDDRVDKNIMLEYTKKCSAQLIQLDDDVLRFIEKNPSLCFDRLIDMGSLTELERFMSSLCTTLKNGKEVVLLSYLFNVKDDYTRIHCENVSVYAVMLGQRLGLSEKELRALRVGGLFHDVGKLGISEDLLKSKNALDDDEYNFVKLHPEIGANIVGEFVDDNVKDIIRYHHERIDGNGYPYGLKGNDIPLLVKIISVVDCFDAMTSNRAYKENKSLDEVLLELERVSNPLYDGNKISQQLDSGLVRTFIDMIKANQNIYAYFNRELDCKTDDIIKLVLK